MKPLLRRNELTGRVYVITRHKFDNGKIVAAVKYDVTDQYEALRAEDSEQ